MSALARDSNSGREAHCAAPLRGRASAESRTEEGEREFKRTQYHVELPLFERVHRRCAIGDDRHRRGALGREQLAGVRRVTPRKEITQKVDATRTFFTTIWDRPSSSATSTESFEPKRCEGGEAEGEADDGEEDDTSAASDEGRGDGGVPGDGADAAAAAAAAAAATAGEEAEEEEEEEEATVGEGGADASMGASRPPASSPAIAAR